MYNVIADLNPRTGSAVRYKNAARHFTNKYLPDQVKMIQNHLKKFAKSAPKLSIICW